jgi:hypothetical protein
MVAATFQSAINIYNTPGIVGDLAFTGPTRAKPCNLYSAGTPNIIGYAFTKTNGANPDNTTGSPNAGAATVGGTGAFAGILINSKEYTSFGTSGAPLNPTLALPDYSIGELATMGEYWINVDNQPNITDRVTFDPSDGSLSTIPADTVFVGSSSTTTLTVNSISSGQIRVNMLIGSTANPGVAPGTYITALGTGLGGAGTYTISISQSIAGSTTITVPSLAPLAFSGTATCASTTLTVASVVSGEVYVGMPVMGVGFAAGTVVTAFIPSTGGVGGTGTYTINQANTVTPAVAITATGNTIIPNATISYYDIAFPGLAVIKLTN